jgi:PTS system mannose-specific IIA component
MKKKAVLVASHGEFAKYALESTQMIMGDQSNCDYLTISVDDTLEHSKKLIKEKIDNLDTKNGLIILVDVFGGTPSNISSEILLKNENTLVVTGLNLPLLLNTFLHQEKTLEELESVLMNSYQEGYVNVKQMMNKKEDEYNVSEGL